jgi:branched-subunit amino acid ABC-type transport system permease component
VGRPTPNRRSTAANDFFSFIVAQCLSALSQAAILFFIACGLTLIFGIMRIVNFAHGVVFMSAPMPCYTAQVVTGSFIMAMILAPIFVGVVGSAFEWIFLRHLYGRRDGGAYLLLTFGLAVVLSELIRIIWGTAPLSAGIPDALRGIVMILDQPFPLYRLFLIGLGIAAAIAIWQFLERTRAGLLIRAVSQNPEMVHALGTNVDLVRNGVFGFGCALAALGGVLAAPLVKAFLGMGTTVVIDAFVIVIIGGMGSLLGSIIGSILVAVVQVFGAYYFQDLALAFMYFLMLVVL